MLLRYSQAKLTKWQYYKLSYGTLINLGCAWACSFAILCQLVNTAQYLMDSCCNCDCFANCFANCFAIVDNVINHMTECWMGDATHLEEVVIHNPSEKVMEKTLLPSDWSSSENQALVTTQPTSQSCYSESLVKHQG